MTVQLPHSVDSRQIIETVTEEFPAAEIRAQRQVTRPADELGHVAAAFEETLTDRQRSVLETAYFAGHFEWPRDSSGQEIAESLDISPATFSQHLRAAQNKVFGALLERTATG